MNWIIFSHECSGKTTFCKDNNFKLKNYDLVDYDKIINVPNENSYNELFFIECLLELQNLDNKIYFTNIFPPEFLKNCKNYFKNLSFIFVILDEERLNNNIKNRHHEFYKSEYIINHHKNLIQIQKNFDFTSFNNFIDFKKYFEPKNIGDIKLPKRIIRL